MTAPTPPHAPNGTHHVRWPADRFYWGVLDASRLGRNGGSGTKQLGYLFEPMLPVPIEEVNAVYERLGDGRVLACGVEREHLATVLDDGAVTLTPETLPTALGDSAEPSRLNVLTGEFVPAPVRRARRRLAILLLLIASAATFLTVVGIERRVQAVETAVAELRARESATYSEVLPALPPGATTLPPERRLAAELARLEQTRRPTAPTANRGTIAPVIGALLARWPKSVHAETSLLSITPDAITVRAEVPSMADAQALATALDAPAGWALDLPQTEAGKDHVDVTIRLRPVEEPPS